MRHGSGGRTGPAGGRRLAAARRRWPRGGGFSLELDPPGFDSGSGVSTVTTAGTFTVVTVTAHAGPAEPP